MSNSQVSEITAIFENGVLRPLSPLGLGEGQQVRLQVFAESPTIEDALEAALRPLVTAGLLTNPLGHSQVVDGAQAELQQLVESLKGTVGQPLSEIIIEDRGEW
jgi:predicted DNA-binding antitoxin AbrB/MazE fold protein